MNIIYIFINYFQYNENINESQVCYKNNSTTLFTTYTFSKYISCKLVVNYILFNNLTIIF